MSDQSWHPWVKREREREAEANRAEIRARIRANRKLDNQETGEEKTKDSLLSRALKLADNFWSNKTKHEEDADHKSKEDNRIINYTVPKDMKKIVVTINDKKSYTITNYITIKSGDTIKLEVK